MLRTKLGKLGHRQHHALLLAFPQDPFLVVLFANIHCLHCNSSYRTASTNASTASTPTTCTRRTSTTSTPATQTQPPPPVVNHTPLTAQPCSIDEILANNVPQGSTLDIVIPCIISSKRKRFKAYARYVGEVLGETGPWVGVEVPIPIGDHNWGDPSQQGEKWNDSSWGGVRYFAIGGMPATIIWRGKGESMLALFGVGAKRAC